MCVSESVCLLVCRSGRRNLNSESVRVCLPGRHTVTCHRDSPPTGVCLSESVSQSACVSESVCLLVCLSPSQCHVTTAASAGARVPAARPPRKFFFSPLINSVQIRFPEMIWVFFYRFICSALWPKAFRFCNFIWILATYDVVGHLRCRMS